MNKHLQNLLQIIQQDETFSADQKSAALKSLKDADKELEITAFKLDRTEKVKHTTAILLEETIEELEQKRKAVEAQNRELEIETALERVRTVAMSMRTPNDLLDICEILYTEFQLLGFNELRNAMINIYEDDKIYFLNYDYAPGPGKTVTHIPYNFHPLINKQVSETKNAGDAFIEFSFAGNELKEFRELRKNNGEQDDPKLDDCSSLHYYFYSFGTGSIGISTYNAVTDEKKNVLKRFRNVFALAYKRYMDITNAEAQARESQIQLALERVRARTMAMQHSDELADAASLLFKQVSDLGIKVWSTAFQIWNPDNISTTAWSSAPDGSIQTPFRLPYDEDIFFKQIYEARRRGEEFFVMESSGKELEKTYKYMFNLPGVKKYFDDAEDSGFSIPTFQITHCVFFSQGYLMFITYDPVPEMWDVFKRFAKVFEQTYTRFLDLQKAEAQAREAQVQLALERVRARTMAMQKQNDLLGVLDLLVEQLVKLGVNLQAANFSNGIPGGDWDLWNEVVADDGTIFNDYVHFPRIEHPFFQHTEKNIETYRKNGTNLFKDVFSKEDKDSWLDYIYTQTKYKDVTPEDYIGQSLYEKPGYAWSSVFLKDTWVSISRFNTIPFSDEEDALLRRFANAFGQAYTRFLDLQKAEAQAREAQIEAALERVRSRTMAMQRSEELAEVATVLFQQVKVLGVPQLHCGFSIFEIDDKEFTWYPGSPDGDILPPSKIPLTEHPVFISFNESRKRGDELFVYEKGGEYQADHYRYMHALPGVGEILQKMLDAGLSFPTFQIDHVANFSHGNLMFITSEHFPAMHDVFKRFAKVFEQTYTRFLDLQKAEAQAREAQIEAALERVRSRSMAMHKSDEIQHVANVLLMQLQNLHVLYEATAVHINIFTEGSRDIVEWTADTMFEHTIGLKIPYFNHPLFNDIFEAKEKGLEFFTKEYLFDEKNAFFNYALENSDYRNLPKELKQYLLECKSLFQSVVFQKNTSISLSDLSGKGMPPTQNQIDVLIRFAKVFEQTYTRFLDLQKAEAQAREGQIQLALERVRARTMAMQHSDELADAASLLFKQLDDLGVKSWSSGFNIWEDDGRSAKINMCNPDGSIATPYHLPHTENSFFKKIFEARKRGDDLLVMETGGKELEETYQYMFSLPEVKKMLAGMEDTGSQIPKFQVNHCAFFSQGYLMFITYEPCPEMWDIFKRFASVFEQTYTRFLDLQKAEAQAREAQIQLSLERVRASAMAMHHSDELSDVLSILFEQFDILDIRPVDAHLDLFDLEKNTFSYRATGKEGKRVIAEQIVDLDSRPEWQSLLQKWKKGKPNTVDFSYYPKEVIKELMAFFPDIWAAMPEDAIMSPEDFPDGIFDALGFCKFGYIGVHHKRKTTEEENKILIRFANEFERLYQRFLDLQKAEAQARESQIQLGLERVRARTMAMQNSSELPEAANLLFQQVKSLGMPAWATGYCIWDEDKQAATVWASAEDAVMPLYKAPLTEDPTLIQMKEAYDRGESFFVEEIGGEELVKHYQYMITLPGFGEMMRKVNEAGHPLPTFQINHVAFFSQGFLNIITYEPVPEAHDIFKRFAKVFEQTYTRFLDLQKAEAQAREAKIEAGLERVRFHTMAMQNSNDVGIATTTMFSELEKLNVKNIRVGIAIFHPDHLAEVWSFMKTEDEKTARTSGTLDMNVTRLWQGLYKGWEQKDEFFHYFLAGEEKKAYYQVLSNSPNYSLSEEIPQLPDQHFQAYYFPEGCIWAYSLNPHTEDDKRILKKFTAVFSLTFRRYQDLKKAEAQAREARLQTSLERVRAAAMAMKKSEELLAICEVMYNELKELGFSQIRNAQIAIKNDERQSYLISAFSDREKVVFGEAPYESSPIVKEIFDKLGGSGDVFYEKEFSGKKFMEWRSWRESLSPVSEYEAHANSLWFYMFSIGNGHLGISTFKKISADQVTVIKRFKNVFELSYQRFTDVAKAEAQAREAQIQLAMERVRARTMAMQHSDELKDAAALLFQQAKALGVPAYSCGYNIWEKNDTVFTSWMSTQDGSDFNGVPNIPLTEDDNFIRYAKSKEKSEEFFVLELRGERMQEHYCYLKTIPAFKAYFAYALSMGFDLPKTQIHYLANFSHGNLLFISLEPCPELHDVFKRFAAVFEQTYTRFLDLQKAEAQAREAQIEVSLERVRSRAMAMQSSEELNELIGTVFTELTKLDLVLTRCIIQIYDPKTRGVRWWMANSETPDEPMNFFVQYHEYPANMAFLKAWQDRAVQWKYTLEGQTKKDWDDFLFTETELSHLPDFVIAGMRAPEKVHLNVSFNTFGDLTLASLEPLSDEQFDIMLRFAKVFDLSYTRFNDLKQAEAQTREAIKRASVDRVRAEIASMRTTSDLERITPLIWNELTTLDVPFIRCGVFIMDEETQQIHTFLSTPDGKAIATLHVPFDFNLSLTRNGVEHWRQKKVYKEHWDAATFIQSWKALSALSETSTASPQNEHPPENLYLHLLPFLQGMLYVGSEVPLTDEAMQLSQNLGDAFSTAYARYEDFNKLEAAKQQVDKTLSDLKQTQAQLVQSEKMASLGELTAGIAHEIQNPLNFVNNFSEVNKELLEEMKDEIKKGNLDEVIALADDLINNEEKINHHGKRAGDIVKGMLQHSRTSSGVKELTDINKLADEYLRLAYHGLRAKDKTFNAEMKTDYEEGIEKIKVVPQDIGRVILNLITNAFYVVNEKAKLSANVYHPTVEVKTRRIKDKIEIIVSDNGNGIPAKVMDKIFQPFFTTKPTGQGTGLGLSLSYDIVKAHGGEIKVETKENEGTEFIIQLPVV